VNASESKPVIDLHADLLSFLAGDASRDVTANASRCSLSQLRAGTVAVQVLPIYVPIQGAAGLSDGQRQVAAFESLLEHPSFRRLDVAEPTLEIEIVGAIENASAFCLDSEPLADGLARIDAARSRMGRLLYTSLTWAYQNRFGGGNGSSAGLSDDGRRLVDFLVERSIAIDFSHTSDALAADLLAHLDQTPEARLLASHSNLRSVTGAARNLSDEVAAELAARGGLIGLTFVRSFIGGDAFSHLARHVDAAVRRGWGSSLALGADFFCPRDLPNPESRDKVFFFPDFENASCYPEVRRTLAPSVTEPQLDALMFGNAKRWLQAWLAGDRAA